MIARSLERTLALGAAILVPLSLRWLSLSRVLAICDRWPVIAVSRATPGALARRVRRWLTHGRGPWKSSCLTRSLVLYVMLRQHSYEPRLVVGVAGAEKDFDAHAWVTLAGLPVADAPDIVGSYTQLLEHHA